MPSYKQIHFLIWMEQVNNELKQFIVNYCKSYRISEIDEDNINLETSLDLDLGIYDIEIDLFLGEFAEAFHIDNSKFSWYKYGYPTGSIGVTLLKTMFGYKSAWVKKMARRIYKPRFSVYHLQQALQTGRLV